MEFDAGILYKWLGVLIEEYGSDMMVMTGTRSRVIGLEVEEGHVILSTKYESIDKEVGY